MDKNLKYNHRISNNMTKKKGKKEEKTEAKSGESTQQMGKKK